MRSLVYYPCGLSLATVLVCTSNATTSKHWIKSNNVDIILGKFSRSVLVFCRSQSFFPCIYLSLLCFVISVNLYMMRNRSKDAFYPIWLPYTLLPNYLDLYGYRKPYFIRVARDCFHIKYINYSEKVKRMLHLSKYLYAKQPKYTRTTLLILLGFVSRFHRLCFMRDFAQQKYKYILCTKITQRARR